MLTATEPQLNVEIVDSCFAYSGFLNILKVNLRHRLFNGEMSPIITRELMERGQAVAVLLYDQHHDAVIMVEQFRIGAMNDHRGAWLLELVAGMIEEGEQPEQVARRESMEESGCEIKKLELIGNYYVSPGGCTEKIMLYFALIDSQGLDGTIAGVDHEAEDIRVSVMPWLKVETMLAAGEINNATALIGLQWLQIQKLRNKL
ncbi:MAG: NUDIX domain-containing protein [Thermodesulfobacteriota bacterium]|nr:NUDIX domain-containing protein [Thermodesulfobacteriota bacterium]